MRSVRQRVAARRRRQVTAVERALTARVQSEHASAVLAGRLRVERRWGRPCLAYNVCVQPGPVAAAALSAIQETTLSLEPSLLRVPESAMHANVVWLLPAHQEFSRPKDELWQRRGSEWMAILADAFSAVGNVSIHYRHLVATDSAVIAIAEEPNRLSALRRELASALRVPGSLSAGDLVHTTLFRYASPLRAPAALLRWLQAAELDIGTDVRELLVIREEVFPSLKYKIVRRLPGAADSA
jgi:hypothetical protein